MMVNFRAIEVTFPINFKRLKPRKMKIYLKIKTLQSSFSFFQKLILSSFNLMAFITKDDRRQSSRVNDLPSSLDSQGSNTSDDRRILSFQTDSKNSSYPLKSPPMLISRVLERTIIPWTPALFIERHPPIQEKFLEATTLTESVVPRKPRRLDSSRVG